MIDYEPAQTLREARGRYFEANGFGAAGGYDEKWVKLAFGPLRFAIPNTPGRVHAVRYHDLHHVVTGYDTDWVGEAEIGAWEIATGCRDLVAAWVLNLYAMWVGLWLSPGAVWRAFLRGRHTGNLYGEPFGEPLLDESVGAMRGRLALDGPLPVAAFGDRLRFAGWCVVAAALAFASGAPLWALLYFGARAAL
jgi:hypothetical protein